MTSRITFDVTDDVTSGSHDLPDYSVREKFKMAAKILRDSKMAAEILREFKMVAEISRDFTRLYEISRWQYERDRLTLF